MTACDISLVYMRRSIYVNGAQGKLYVSSVILGGKRKQIENLHSCLLSGKLKKELLFNYSPWLMNILIKVVHFVVVNKYTGKKFTL